MAKRQGALLYELEPDLVLLQEVNPAQRRCCAGQPVPTGSFGLSICCQRRVNTGSGPYFVTVTSPAGAIRGSP